VLEHAGCRHGVNIEASRGDSRDMLGSEELVSIERTHNFAIETTFAVETGCHEDGSGVLYLRRENAQQGDYGETDRNASFGH